ncbi:putative nicotinate-nucleotide adenylyltransferase [Endomicrobiia bacterium]|uniref:Probable nicotinate-nucleotide adenylyltransferase n=1 Tax=Endomicrobium trichonymphae TaxID=1408204 RepID=NADD_ENDTX|nr:nicotinate (nicotinamide) nucleotide adenylyltransferase [Candidatus Endomicrobium trichonymphae]B1H028.1 RecName: Full=Probable nicotinate-nucleotide adenylyltransferase; AltName: Full=Deamido-NAD(+) diphosphorylase; AltName: Full=Deamido-NAD(+) pyrophosphorylase; AltName: Full=Nicotinate mononucleotide adenylyltransferase; Short=NaMN adenylyltransferase [Candidatus Endomicrobium trichonymphae]GHT05631.1 putative nicotinate-nucleotide adenylyltransferase [Endomicrobiia bacterium]BAG13860.1 n
MHKVAIFGGSFDPVHKSHIQIAKLAFKSLDLKKMIFVIAYTPPHKTKQYAYIEDRISMLKLATGNMQKTEISLYEAQKLETVYSYQTLDYFNSLYPEDEIYMVIGSDSLLDLPIWNNIDYMAGRYKFIVAKRHGFDEVNKNVKYLDRCVFIDKETEDISSTEIRRLVKEDYKKAVSMLNKKVYNYIIQNGLYK